MENLIQKYEDAKALTNTIYQEIIDTSDGFLYVTCLRCYGSIFWETHKNEFVVQELCNEYYGDNGIVDVYTNNSDHKISSYGNIAVMSYDEIVNMSKENISMSSAITNWLTAGFQK